MRAGAALVLVAALAGGAAGAGAETLWVTDRLQLGVHADRTLESAIVKVLPSGTPLEVLAREGSFVQVETEDGLVGWVDATYLDAHKPAAKLIEEMRVASSEQAEALEASRARVEELEQAFVEAADRAEAAEAELAATRAEIDTLRRAAERRPAPAPVEPPVPNETLRDVQRLAEENRALKQRISELEAGERMRAERADAEAGAAPPAAARTADRSHNPYASLLALERWHWLLFGSALVLALGAGAQFVDWNVRRRHGGFRV